MTIQSLAANRGSGVTIRGQVRVASGPWRVEDEWWTETPAERDYWDIELDDGGIYRLFRDRRTNSWYADGIYD